MTYYSLLIFKLATKTMQNVSSICFDYSDTPAKRASSVTLNTERARSQVIIFTWRPRCTLTLVQNVACAESSSHGDPFSSSMSITTTSNVGGNESKRIQWALGVGGCRCVVEIRSC